MKITKLNERLILSWLRSDSKHIAKLYAQIPTTAIGALRKYYEQQRN